MSTIGRIEPRRHRASTLLMSRGQSDINTLLFWALTAVVVISPIPLGSNRALAWSIWAAILGVIGMLYAFFIWRREETLRVRVGNLWPQTVLMALTCGFLVVQLLPLGGIFPGLTTITASGFVLEAERISIAPNMTALMLVRQLSYCTLFFLMLQACVNDQRRALLLRVLLVAVCGFALYGLIALQTGDTILGLPKWAYRGVATGPFVNRNSFATFLALGAMIAAGLIGGHLARQSERHRDDGRVRGNSTRIALCSLAYLILMSVIVATQSRMGLTAAIAGTLAVALLTAVVTRRWRTLAAAILMLVAFAVVSAVLFGGGLLDRVESIGGAEDVRWSLYRQIFELVGMRPWTGFGGGSFELAFPLVHAAPVDFDLVWSRAHNSYLALWAELGVVVGSMPVLALGIIAVTLLAGILRSQGSFTAQVTAFGALVVGGVHSLADFSLEIEANTFLFLTVLAAGLAPLAARTTRTKR